MRGVRRTRVGYTGGTTTNPTYNAVCRGSTGHSEALRIVFDPSVISFEDLLKAFFSMHAYQYKSKAQYMSAIFVQGDAQRTAAENFVAKLEQRGDVATRILPAAQWYDAEEYHPCYHEKNRAIWYASRPRARITPPRLSRRRRRRQTRVLMRLYTRPPPPLLTNLLSRPPPPS